MAGIAEALERGLLDRGVLILADSKAARKAARKAGRTGNSKRQEQEHGVRLACVKAYVGIPGNEKADEGAKFFTKVVGSEVLTGGGLHSNSWHGGRQSAPRWVGEAQE